jgi:hypothetical protein
MDHSIARSVGFTGNEQFPWQVPFNLQDRPSFAWRTKEHKGHEDLCDLRVLCGSMAFSASPGRTIHAACPFPLQAQTFRKIFFFSIQRSTSQLTAKNNTNATATNRAGALRPMASGG